LSFVGLVPSERCSGDGRRQGSITTAGSAHARRLLVGGAWNSRRPPTVGFELARRHRGQDPPGDQTLALDRQALVTANAQQALAADENQESAGA
jgi:transposase